MTSSVSATGTQRGRSQKKARRRKTAPCRVETMRIACVTTGMSTTLTTETAHWRCTTTGMSNPVQERHLESLCGQLHSLHCGYTSLEHNRKVHHSLDELIRGTFMLSKRITILFDGLTLAIFSSIFVGKMCIFVTRPMKIVTSLRKNGETPTRVVDFPLERDTFRNKIMEIVADFAYESIVFFIFLSFFIIFLHFSFSFIFSFFHFFFNFFHFFTVHFFIFPFYFHVFFSFFLPATGTPTPRRPATRGMPGLNSGWKSPKKCCICNEKTLPTPPNRHN